MRPACRAALASALAVLIAGVAAADPAILDDDPSGLLGMTPVEAIARLGPPPSVYSARGDEPWQDDVAFSYPEGYTLFLCGDRVWQLRLSTPYSGSILGLFLGDSADKACALMGQPFESGPDFIEFRLQRDAFPVRLLLALAEGRVVDAYLYRSDV